MNCKTAVNNSDKKQYGMIDIVRMFMALCVLFIHRSYSIYHPMARDIIRESICEMAVPFFVITTAFFFYKKCAGMQFDRQKTILLGYVKRLVVLLLIWTIIYIPVRMFEGMIANDLTLTEVLKNLLSDFFIKGETYLHLWYIQALIVSSVLIFFAGRIINKKALFVAFYLFYVFYSFYERTDISSVKDAFSVIPASLMNYICRISIYIVLGRIIAEKSDEMTDKKRVNIILPLSVIFYLCACFIRFFAEKNAGIILQFALLPFLIYYFFAFLIKFEFSFKGEADLRKFTELFYFSHLLVPIQLYQTVFSAIGMEPLSYYVVIKMAFYIVITTTVSLIILMLSKTKPFKFLKYLY